MPRNVLFINHHLYQEGDAYGLIYALLLSGSERVGDEELHALFYVDGDKFEGDTTYKAQVERRFGYFRSFGLLGPRVKVVFCRFNPDPYVFAFKVRALGPWALEIQCNGPHFKNNPRKVSLAVTGEENDVGKERLKLSSQLFDEDIEKLPRAIRVLFEAERAVLHGGQGPSLGTIGFRYISYSTDYILRCVRTVGFERVTDSLVSGVLGATRQYTETNQAFLERFTQALFERKLRPEEREENPLIILFWIRGAKQDEAAAIESREAGTSVGKPQHHTNLTLYKQVRAVAKKVGEVLTRRILFVPIGDELSEELLGGDEFRKGSKEYNLIQFFRRPEFQGKPMGAQMNFLTLMALRYSVVQVGMRSGSMERLMYLGVPTIYFDRTLVDDALPPLVGASRIRQLCGLSEDGRPALTNYLIKLLEHLRGDDPWKKGFPYFFHIESRDTGFMRYSTSNNTTIEGTIQRLIETLPKTDDELRLSYNLFKKLQAYKVDAGFCNACKLRFAALGGLAEPEAQRLALMLWFIDQTYPNYASLRSLHPMHVVKIRLDDYGRELHERMQVIEREIAAKRLARASKTSDDEPFDMSLLFPPDEEEAPQQTGTD